MARLLSQIGPDGARRLLKRAGSLVTSECLDTCCGLDGCPCFFRIRICEGQNANNSCGSIAESLILIPCETECLEGGQILPDDVPDDGAVYRLITINGLCYEVLAERYYPANCATPEQRSFEFGEATLLDLADLNDLDCFAPGTTCDDGDCPQAVGYIYGVRCAGSTGPNEFTPYLCSRDIDQCLSLRVSGPNGTQDCYTLDPASQQYDAPPPLGQLVSLGNLPAGITAIVGGDCCDCLDTVCDQESGTLQGCNNITFLTCCCDGTFEWRVVDYVFRQENLSETGFLTITTFNRCADDGAVQCESGWCLQSLTYPPGVPPVAGNESNTLIQCADGVFPGENVSTGCLPPVTGGFVTPVVGVDDANNDLSDCGFVQLDEFRSREFNATVSGNCVSATQRVYLRRIDRSPSLGGGEFRRTISEIIRWRRTRLTQSANCSGGCRGGDSITPLPNPFDPPTGPAVNFQGTA